jgi:hypothetical protein
VGAALGGPAHKASQPGPGRIAAVTIEPVAPGPESGTAPHWAHADWVGWTTGDEGHDLSTNLSNRPHRVKASEGSGTTAGRVECRHA